MKKNTKRILYFSAFILTLLIEIYIAVFVRDRFIRPYIGDVLSVMVVYFFIHIFWPDRCKWLPLYVFLFAVCVEITQYFHLAKLLELDQNRVLSIILGGSFDWIDIICYGAGCCVIWALSLI